MREHARGRAPSAVEEGVWIAKNPPGTHGNLAIVGARCWPFRATQGVRLPASRPAEPGSASSGKQAHTPRPAAPLCLACLDGLDACTPPPPPSWDETTCGLLPRVGCLFSAYN